VQPTGRGFDFLANPRLVLREGVPWIAAGPESSRISAPLRADGVAWARIRLAAGTVAPPVPATPKREFNAGADGKISIGVDGAHLEFAGIRFAYRPELARFDCQRCRAATGFGDRVITMLGNDELMSWTRGADGSLRDPVRIPPPPGRPAAALWSDGSGVILETAPNADEARSQFVWDGKAWSDHRTSRLARRTDAAWDWDGEGTLKVRGRPCQIQFDRFPRLDFEDVDPAEDRRGAPLRSLADDRVVYRTAGGRWYSVTSSGLPEPLSESPPSMPDNAAVGDLSFTRWPTDGPFPRCTLAGMDGSSTISLKVESGLIRDLDGWDSSSELLRIADDRMRVRMRAVGVYREIQLKDGRLDLSPPRYLRDFENDRREAGLPLRKDGPLALNKGHGILCGELLLGVPGPKGLTGLDAGSAVPLSLSRLGGASTLEYVVPDGSRYRVQVDRVLDSIVRIATEPTIDRTRWEVSGGNIELVAEAKDGRRFLVEAAGVPPKPLDRKREDMAELVRSTDAGLVPQRADRGSLRLTRGGDRPLTVIMRQAADGLTLDHLDANRIGNLDDGLMTFSPRWVTRYARSGETLSVHSVVPAESGPKPVETLPLGGGLFARHIGSRGWELRTSEEPDAPRWDLERFTGPERTYLAGESAMFEAGNDWWRRSRLDGSIVERRVGADLASLANPTAFRDGEILADGEIRWSLDPDGTPSKIANREVAPRRLAKVESGPWTISLDRGGDDLSVAVVGRRMAVADGSLPIDFAVAVGGGRGHDWIIDRFGLHGSHQGTSRWTPHSDEPLASLGDAEPVRLAGLDWQGEIQRALPDRGGAWRLPMAEDPGLVRSDGRLLDSWTSGSRLAIRLGTDGQANFFRRPMASDPWFRYPSIDLGSACEAGRFAFDVPVALALAGSGDGSPPSACVRMRLGWERFEFGSGTGSSRFLLAEPEPVEPPYGSAPRDEWLTTSDLDLTAIRAATNDLGPISLAFPFEGRLFLLGEDRSAWIELGKRWRDRPLP
jgi:hypothetical protein